MKKNLIILMTILSIGIIGCANSPTEELTKEEQEAIYREEVRKKLDEEEETTISETEEAEELESEEEPGTEEILSEKNNRQLLLIRCQPVYKLLSSLLFMMKEPQQIHL
uniref:hypothetical protein n=1 Tax=Globicatella sulfidifaciens TaxID=136093 RepID=UPI0023F12297|nr:hypothetical protein [Globicatella sulfidifaciens]